MSSPAYFKSCRRLRFLAFGLGVVIAAIVVLIDFLAPFVVDDVKRPGALDMLQSIIWHSPAVAYVYALWTLAGAMRELESGGVMRGTVTRAIRRMGAALALGGLLSVVVAPNILRFFGAGGFFNFDIAALAVGATGLCLVLLSRIVDEARLVKIELDSFI